MSGQDDLDRDREKQEREEKRKKAHAEEVGIDALPPHITDVERPDNPESRISVVAFAPAPPATWWISGVQYGTSLGQWSWPAFVPPVK